MPLCKHCGQHSPDDSPRCNNCGIAFGHQLRAKADEVRSRNGKIVRTAAWILVVAVLLVVGPAVYRAGNSSYQRYHLRSTIDNAIKACGGPVTASTPGYEQAQIEHCLSTDEKLLQAQRDYALLTKADKAK
jgi:hypothetical protein